MPWRSFLLLKACYIKNMIVIKSISAQATWSLRHQVMWPTKPLDFVKLPEDAKGKHFGLYSGTELISVVSIFIHEDGVAQFRKLATKTEEQGKGYGSKLLTHLITYAREQNIHTLWCNARIEKTSFYKKFGLITTDKKFKKANIHYVILQMDLTQILD